MQPNKSTLELLSSLDAFSGHRLRRQNDLATLIDAARNHPTPNILDDLSFLAKFISKTYGIMQRIGKDGDGHDRLVREFTEVVTSVRDLLQQILVNTPQTIKDHFSATYLDMTSRSLQDLLALCYDLSWYKNWLLDHQGDQPGKRIP